MLICRYSLSCYLQLAILFFSKNTPTTDISTLSLHDALPISPRGTATSEARNAMSTRHTLSVLVENKPDRVRSEEHTSELQSRGHLVCRLLLEKKKRNDIQNMSKSRRGICFVRCVY